MMETFRHKFSLGLLLFCLDENDDAVFKCVEVFMNSIMN